MSTRRAGCAVTLGIALVAGALAGSGVVAGQAADEVALVSAAAVILTIVVLATGGLRPALAWGSRPLGVRTALTGAIVLGGLLFACGGSPAAVLLEEAAFRVVPIACLVAFRAGRRARIVAALVSCLTFTLAHDNLVSLATIDRAVFGAVLFVLAARTGHLGWAFCLHAGSNLAWAVLAWSAWGTVTGYLVDVVLLAGALGAVVRRRPVGATTSCLPSRSPLPATVTMETT